MKNPFILLSLLFAPFLCGAQDVPTIQATLKDPGAYDGFTGGCSLGCAISWKLSASSQLKDGKQSDHRIEKLEDRDGSTAWIEGAEGYGIGERIRISFFGNLDSNNVPFYEIGVRNGHCKDQGNWEDHARWKKALLKKNGTPRMTLAFHDSKKPQVFTWEVDRLSVTDGDTITLELLEVYEGEEDERTALSDMHLMGAH